MKQESLVLGISTAGPVELGLTAAGQEVVAASNGAALESLLTLLRRALRQAGVTIGSVSVVGVCTGPGSFTGLRIGVVFAKSLAQTQELPIVGISAYDVAACHIQTHPVIAVARGKPEHYYARITIGPNAQARYIQGSRAIIEQAAMEIGGGAPATIVGPDFSPSRPGDAALAVAQLARRAIDGGSDQHWTKIAIDYGQRPNAVLNWEQRRVVREEGPPVSPREHSTQ